ncbi:MAG: site-specific DNA-methyltransferase [Kiritimatiellae bacterium]|nr:site-specific DNA-methyltransferase [Kiritimatiellia bacterium]MBP5788303.1 site-specific DNA-methyltransferase [Kiritimatiellia bacterium]
MSARNTKKIPDFSVPRVRCEDAAAFLASLPKAPVFDLTVTSPPYGIGKSYEHHLPLNDYRNWQRAIIREICIRTKPQGSVCWQVGNWVDKGEIWPLDILLAPIFREFGMKMRNRIVWHFGHGTHAKRRFSGRHETILWFTKSDDYTFNLDAVRVPSKYPGKRSFRGAHKGELSGNPLGKNPEDVWDIPNVVGNHVEKTAHPCQFPVGLISRLVRALSNKNDLVYDPFSGSGTTAVAALSEGRRFVGTEILSDYVKIANERIARTLAGEEVWRPAEKPIYDHRMSNLSERPKEWGSLP